MNKGYHLLNAPEYKPIKELTLVGCKRCRRTWREEYFHTTAIRINGPMYMYDACDQCLEPGDVEKL